MRAISVSALAIAFLAVACESKSGGSGAAASSSAAPGAAAGCPDGSSGEGTTSSPCKAGSPTSRLMELKWTGKIGSKGPIFAVTNKAKRPISQGDVQVYFYDAAGKQLQVSLLGMSDKKSHFWTSGAVFNGDGVKAGETQEVEFGQGPAMFPAGAVNAEGEASRVCFATGKPDWDCDVNWENAALKGDTRAQVAPAPPGAKPFVAAGAASAPSAAVAAGKPTTGPAKTTAPGPTKPPRRP